MLTSAEGESSDADRGGGGTWNMIVKNNII